MLLNGDDPDMIACRALLLKGDEPDVVAIDIGRESGRDCWKDVIAGRD